MSESNGEKKPKPEKEEEVGKEKKEIVTVQRTEEKTGAKFRKISCDDGM